MRTALLLVALLLCVQGAHTKDVTMNFAFSINGKAGDSIHVNGTDYDATTPYSLIFRNLQAKFIAASDGAKLAALIFGGSHFRSISMNTAGSDYVMSVTQSDNENRVVLAFTNGTWQDASKNVGLDYGRIIPAAVGALTLPAPARHTLFMRLRMPFELYGDGKFSGSSKLLIKNSGTPKAANVTIQNVK